MKSSPPITMQHLPILDRHATKNAGPDLDKATGNLVDAKHCAEALKSLINDAVYLDEDAFSEALHAHLFQNKLREANRKIHEMELEAASLRAEIEAKNEELMKLGEAHKGAVLQVQELKAELDNNAGQSVVLKQ